MARPQVDDDGHYLDDWLVSRHDAALLVDVTERVVEHWQQTGILPVRARVRGKPWYHAEEVFAAELHTRPTRRRRRPYVR